MSVNARDSYNQRILEDCLEQLKSTIPDEQYAGVVSASYLLEQTFKFFIKKTNPLLCFDRRCLTESDEIKILQKRMTVSELTKLKTIPAKQCLAYILELKPKLQEHKANLEELFSIRNEIVHSTEDISFDSEIGADTAVNALKASESLITKYWGLDSEEFNPLTSKEFKELEEKGHKKRISALNATIALHRKIFKTLSKNEVEIKVNTPRPAPNKDSWIEETSVCPSCKELSLDKIAWVEWEWEHGEMCPNTGTTFECRVCGLELSEYAHQTLLLESSFAVKKLQV